MTAAVQARAAAERLLGTVRVQAAWVRRRDGSWYGPVWVREELDGGRAGYAYHPQTGDWYCPARWKPYSPAGKQALVA
jgi:hypothetical protein